MNGRPLHHSGLRPVGQRFPTELELMAESRYSRETVRQAVKILRDEGLVVVTIGVGTFTTGGT